MMMRVSSTNNRNTYLFESLVVYKASSILGDLELPLLYLLAELPAVSNGLSAQIPDENEQRKLPSHACEVGKVILETADSHCA